MSVQDRAGSHSPSYHPALRTGPNMTTGWAGGYGVKSEDGENNWLYVDVDDLRDVGRIFRVASCVLRMSLQEADKSAFNIARTGGSRGELERRVEQAAHWQG